MDATEIIVPNTAGPGLFRLQPQKGPFKLVVQFETLLSKLTKLTPI